MATDAPFDFLCHPAVITCPDCGAELELFPADVGWPWNHSGKTVLAVVFSTAHVCEAT